MSEPTSGAKGQVELREVTEDDLPIFFEHQLDPEANRVAAFTDRDPADRDGYMARWAEILADETIIKRTILFDGAVVGNILSFVGSGKREVGYWLGREHWGKGIATRALSEFLSTETTRPLHASAAKDNVGSVRVLENNGFVVTGYTRDFAKARGEEIDEVMFELR